MESILVNNEEIQKRVFNYLDIDSMLELRLINKAISEVATKRTWEVVTEDHYGLEDFESLLIKNAHHIVKLTVNNMDNKLNGSKITFILEKLKNIKSIEFRYFATFKLVYKFLDGLASKFLDQIVAIDIGMCGIEDSQPSLRGIPQRKAASPKGYENSILSVVAKFPNLTKLSLSDLEMPETDINQMFINMISKKLELVSMQIFGSIMPETFQVLKEKYSTTLKHIEFGLFERRDVVEEFEKLILACKNLEELITGPMHGLPKDYDILGNVSAEDLPNLKVIDLSSHDFPNQYDKFFNQNWDSVRCLYLNNSIMSSITAKILVSKFKKLDGLGFVDVEELTQESLKSILGSNLSNIKGLQLIGLKFPLQLAWPTNSEFPKLGRIMLVHLSMDNELLKHILTKNKVLEEIVMESVQLSNYENILSELSALREKNMLQTRQLKTLVIINDQNVDCNFIKNLIEIVNYNLTEVDIKGTKMVPEEFMKLAESFPKINFDFQAGYEDEFDDEYDDEFSGEFSSSGDNSESFDSIISKKGTMGGYEDDHSYESERGYNNFEANDGELNPMDYSEPTGNIYPEDDVPGPYENPFGGNPRNRRKTKAKKGTEIEYIAPKIKGDDENDVD
ncbi:hypothetical protein AYI68_g2770 [Smittium mucronatum]|uniref:F-box domain-containing protein n=1 Tax=Smittium mucronatum TaxID=133383 RepID=A0A1R0H1T4_9FUNG|nr:hypothetical protein AYI68_g2770 [Smittium mucronatum]